MKTSEKLVMKNHELVTSPLDGHEQSDSRPSQMTAEKIVYVGSIADFGVC
jgi:hypothetical protein